MITLYAFGPAQALPDPSPFVAKAEMLLKLANRPYRMQASGLRNAPKRKLPYIVDDRETIADSTFIRLHLEKKYGFDFDAGLTREQRAVAWAFEKMLEDHLYWAIVRFRWMDGANFARGPAHFFETIPMPIRPLIVAMIRRSVRKALHGQGLGRHSEAEIAELAGRALAALADHLGDKPYMMGPQPTGLDAVAFPFAAGALTPVFDGWLRGVAERHENLRRYVGRMAARYYPDCADFLRWCAAA